MVWNYIDAFFYSLMVGAGEAFFTAYALKLGHSELQAGLISTVPIVIAGLIQILAPAGINKIKSYKKWTLIGVTFQSLVFLAFIFLDNGVKESYALFFTLVTIYWSLGLSITPGWSSWISGLLETHKIRLFFANRNITLAVGTLMGLCFSGLMLNYADEVIFGFQKFNFIFLLCFMFRSISLVSLMKLQKVPFKMISSFKENIQRLRKNHDNHFVLKFIYFSSFIKLGVYYSASFFTPYMLKKMNWNYLDYMLILAAAYAGRAFLGRYIQRHLQQLEINKLYLIASIGISLVPIFWVFSESFYYILILEVLTGVLWGSFEIAFFITCFEEIKTENQASYMSYYNLIHTLAIGLGCLLGALSFYYLGNEVKSYHHIFLISGGLRFLSLLIFPRKTIKSTKGLPVVTRLYAVRPNMGFVGKTMWAITKKLKK